MGDLATFNGSVWQRVEGGADLKGVNLSVSGTSTLSGLTASTALALNASKEIVSVTNTGTGNNVLATAPTLVGDVSLSTGNLVVGTDGKGITGSTGTRGVLVTSTGSRQLGSVDALHGNQSYTKAEVIYTNSAFSNPVVTLLDFAVGGASQYGSLTAKITVYQQGWGFGGTNIHQGFAQVNANGAGGYDAGQVSLMTLVQSFGNINVGTLSWSGQTLSYTCNRASNFDTYTIVIEVGLSGTNMQTQGATVTFGTLS